MATQTATVNPEFLYVPTPNIVVLEQVRSTINIETDSFKSLAQSIKDKGILEPLLVMGPEGDSYTLLCGERRLVAARQLGFETVPVRVIKAGRESGEVIALQLTENLQREDINPIDQAKGILAYIQAKLPVKNYDVDGVMSALVTYNRRPEDLQEEIATTVVAIAEIAGKSINTMYNGLSLLKLPEELRKAIAEGMLPVSQGYLFAANLDCPDIGKIFQDILKVPVTNATLSHLLASYKKVKPNSSVTKPMPITKQLANLRSMRSDIEMNTGQYTKPDLEMLLDDLRTFCTLIEERLQAAPIPPPAPE